jgi:hypothetical protein
MGVLLAIVVFGVCVIYPPYSILKSEDVGISKSTWAATAFCSPFGVLLIPVIAERLVSPPIASADIVFGWIGFMRSIANIVALLAPWCVSFAYERKHKATSRMSQSANETQPVE